MKIVVCLKPVPDPAQADKIRIDPETHNLIRTGIPLVINPLDLCALEAALSLKDECKNIEVIGLSLAPPQASEVLKEAYARGLNKIFLLTDPVFIASDTWATAYALSKGIRYIGSPDFIFCGAYSSDGGTSHIPSQLGEFLNFSTFLNVFHIDIKENLIIKRRLDDFIETIQLFSPSVLGFSRFFKKPRQASLGNYLKVFDENVTTLNAKDLGILNNEVGMSGSLTEVIKVYKEEIKKENIIMKEEDINDAGLFIYETIKDFIF